MGNSKLRHAVAKSISIKTMLEEEFGQELDRMIRCPFHPDENPSAKFYEDEDGITRLYCHACKKQYTSYDLIKNRGEDPRKYLTIAIDDVEEIERKKLDLADLEGFRVGEFGIDEFLRRLMNVE